jgi:hypothetical protein
MSISSSGEKRTGRIILILIAGIVVVLAIVYVIKHREGRLTSVVSSGPQSQARVSTTTSSAALGHAVPAEASSRNVATAGVRATSTSLPRVIPSPTATGPETGKYLQQDVAGMEKYIRKYDPHAATDIPIVADVMYGRVHKLSDRLDAGLNPNMTIQSGSEPEYSTRTLLYYAIATGQRAIIKELVDRGASTNPALGAPLVEAAGMSETDVVKYLLQHGANPNQSGIMGSTALTEAIIMGNYPMAKVLLRAGADPNQISGRARSYMNHSTKPTVAAIRKLVNGG